MHIIPVIVYFNIKAIQSVFIENLGKAMTVLTNHSQEDLMFWFVKWRLTLSVGDPCPEITSRLARGPQLTETATLGPMLQCNDDITTFRDTTYVTECMKILGS